MILTPDQCPIEEYHDAAPKFFSKTPLMAFDDMALDQWHKTYVTKEITKDTPNGAAEGSMLDAVLTEGWESFRKSHVKAPSELINERTGSMYGRTSLRFEEWSKANPGVSVVDDAELKILERCVDSVQSHPAWKRIDKYDRQMTIRATDDYLGFGLQSRPDFLSIKDGIVVDLKKTFSLKKAPKQAVDLGYILQAVIGIWALHEQGIEVNAWQLLFCEWGEYPRTRLWEIPTGAIAWADGQMRDTAEAIRKRIADDDWTDHPPLVEHLPLQGWMRHWIEENGYGD